MKLQYYSLLIFLGLGIVCVAAGCGGETAKSMMAAAADNNMKKLGSLYMQFQMQNKEESLIGPADESEFKDFIRTQNPEGLELLGIDVNNLDAMFVGERDDKPFKIRWGVQGYVRGPAVPVLFEQDGVDGKFMVGFNGFQVKEVDKAEYDRMWSGETDNPDDGA